jgi:GTP-binding protein
MRSIQALEEADVCIIMLDATRGIESQDVNIVSLAAKNKKGMVLMVNKWDLVEKDPRQPKSLQMPLWINSSPMDYLPVIFTSVTEKQRIFKAIEKAVEVYENRRQKIPTSALNDAMLKEIENYPPPAIKGKFVKIKYVTQLPIYTPTFAFFCNLPQYIQPAYERYLENKCGSTSILKECPLQWYSEKNTSVAPTETINASRHHYHAYGHYWQQLIFYYPNIYLRAWIFPGSLVF